MANVKITDKLTVENGLEVTGGGVLINDGTLSDGTNSKTISKLLTAEAESIDMTSGASSNSKSYYLVLENGLIINWGWGSNTSGSATTHTFSYPYTKMPAVAVSGFLGGTNYEDYGADSIGRVMTIADNSTTGFSTYVRGTNDSNYGTWVLWIAIGV